MLIQTLNLYKSVRLGLDEKKTFNKEMNLLSTIEFIEAIISSDNSELTVIE